MPTTKPNMNALERLKEATRMLGEIRTAKDAKKLTDLAAAAEYYARKAKLGAEAIGYAHTIKIEAKEKLGEFQSKAEKATGGTPYRENSTGTREVPVETLADLGITKKESAEAQQLHQIAVTAPAEYEAVRTGEKSLTQVRRELKRAEVKQSEPLPSGKYRVVYADPPWKYGDQLTEDYGATEYHYPSMSISELCALPVQDLVEENAVLFLWVTSPLLFGCPPVIKSWGFKYKTSFVWDKIKHNIGHYNSVRHEFLLICTRGSCLPDARELVDSVQSIDRTAHSEKPEEFRDIIDKLYTHGARIELFARTQVEGWDRWGNQS